ncbi:hypothetical protein G6F35_017891 [Rhizopus arrhizus]|nr:hypothetical protein G6F35_017891 [Rhizopus arrhizus]
MLDLAQIHSLTLGYKWSPPKCAVLNAPTVTSSRYVPMSLYDQDLPTVEEFTYLGVPFDGKGISVTAMIKHRASGTLAAMAQLHSMGLNRQGFPLLLSSRLFAAFIRPKLEPMLTNACRWSSNGLNCCASSYLQPAFDDLPC